MENGLRGNRGENLIQVISGGTHALRPGFEYWVVGVAELWLPPSAPQNGEIKIKNLTTSATGIFAAGSTTISGISRSSGAAIVPSASVRLLAGQQGFFAAFNGGWIAQGCEPSAITFAYNGTPLTINTSNPLNAGGLFHYLGIVQGGGTWTNPANTAVLTSVASSLGSGTVANLTDRVGSGQDVYSGDVPGSWFGWQFPKLFRCKGFIFQTRGLDTNHLPRQLEARVSTGTTLTSATNVTAFPVVQSWSGQTQITATNTYYGQFVISEPSWGNQLVIRQSGVDSIGYNRLTAQEFEVFGDYEP